MNNNRRRQRLADFEKEEKLRKEKEKLNLLIRERELLNVPLISLPSIDPPKRQTICLSFYPSLKKGGSHHFIFTLMDTLKDQFNFTYNLRNKFDLLLVVADLYKSIEYIKEKKQQGTKIVHRVDGSFYHHGYAPAGRDILQREISSLSDLIIYQSQYSKTTLEDMGIIDRDKNNIIIPNGVNRSIFNPISRTLSHPLGLISANNSTLKIKRVERLNSFIGPNTSISYIGKHHPSVTLDSSIRRVKILSSQELSNEYLQAHVYVHTGDKDTCPNSAIEALSVGLPVIYWKSSGGVEELVRDAGLAVEDFKCINEVVESIKKDYSKFHRAALIRAQNYNIVNIAKQYSDIFRKVIQ